MRREFCLVGLEIVERLRRRKYDPVIIEKMINFVLALLQIFSKALHSDYQGGWDYMTGLFQTSSEERRP